MCSPKYSQASIYMRKTLIPVVLVCALALVAYIGLREIHTGGPGNSPAVIAVRVISVSPQDVPRTLSGRGTVESPHGDTRTAPLIVEFALPQSTMPVLQQLIQDSQDPPVLAYADTDDAPTTPLAEGRLTLIDNQIAPSDGTVRVKAEFENTRKTLHTGQTVDLQLQIGLLRQVLAVPPKVVQRGIEQAFVYRLEHDTAVSIAVKVVYQSAQLDVIEGVEDGDTLIIDGPEQLKPGARVHIVSQSP